MSVQSVTCSRTLGHARNLCSTALAIGGFLAATAALFAFSLDASEGTQLPLNSLWTLAASQVLPLLCVVLAMDSWSEERRTGRIDLLLSLPVLERDLVIGKFLGLTILSILTVGLSLALNLLALWLLAPTALAGVSLLAFLPALAALALQAALYIASAMAVSALFANAVAAATVALAVVWALPRGLWQAVVAWSPSGSGAFGEFPLDAHAVDIASGSVSVAVVLFYVIATVTALFIASKALMVLRFRGRSAVFGRLSTAFCMVLALVVAGLATVSVARLKLTVELPVEGEVELGERTRKIISEVRGTVTATCFMPRTDRRFRPVSRLLRSLSRKVASLGVGELDVVYVDPRWDVGKAGRLVREGIESPAVVFSNRRRRVALPLAEGWGEHACASALLRLMVPSSRNGIYWTFGHGEASFSDYGPVGMSDIARELSREGYRNFTVDLASETAIPSDCALIAVAGATREFSRSETTRLEAFLRQGGRLLVMAEGEESALLSTLIPAWGAIVKGVAAKPPRTLSGTDSVISDFGEHPVSSPLKGSQIVLERPVLFAPSAAAGFTTEADRIGFTTLAATESLAAAVMLERGTAVGSDVAVRPTRIAVLGDAAFVRNAELETRANANRDFFLNCVSYLSGSQAITSGGTDGGLLFTGLDRRGRVLLINVAAIALPAAVVLVLLFIAWRRKLRR